MLRVLVSVGAGLDVHRDFVEACVVYGPDEKDFVRRKFETFPDALEELRVWLAERGCTHVAMESTSVFWRPIYDALEGAVEIVVCNAQHVKQVPGRKTDVTDARWLAVLLRYGLLAKSYVPERRLRELREVTRYMTKLTQSKTAFLNRAHKTLQIGGIKLSSVASEAFGVSGRLMLEAIIDGEESVPKIADLAKGRLRKKIPQLERVFRLPISDHRRQLLGLQLGDIDRLEASLASIEELLTTKLAPNADFIERVADMPGSSDLAAAVLLAEIGPDMSPWRTDFAKLAAWCGVAPGNHQSASKRRRTRTRDGNPYVKTMLVEIAQAAVKQEGSRFQAMYRSDKPRLGAKRALVKIAHAWLRCFFEMMVRGERYREVPAAALDQSAKQRKASKLLKRLKGLGYTLTASESAPSQA
jgi:transposase